MLNDIYERGVERLGLICANGLKGLEDVIAEVFPKTPVSSNFVSADFRKMRTDSFQKSRTTRFRKIRVVR